MADTLYSDYTVEDFGTRYETPRAWEVTGIVTDGKDFKRSWGFFIPKSQVETVEDFIPQWILDKEVEEAEKNFGEKAQMIVPKE